MLRFLLCFLLLILTIVPIRADDALVPAPERYATATRHLREGQVFQTAINDLQKAVSQDPKNGSYHLALGCADADRAASLGYAAVWAKQFQDARTDYPKQLADWEAAQQDPKSDGHGTFRPTPPPDEFFVHTKDDGRLFGLTETQSAAQINALSLAAQSEWRQAIALAKNPKDRAEAEYTQGWGLQILAWATSGVTKPIIGPDGLSSQPKPEDAVEPLEAATKDASDNAVYWQSLGDAHYNIAKDDRDTDPVTLDAYRRSLKIKPGNSDLWYRLFDMQQKSDPDEAETDMRQAARYDSSNAYPQYQLAMIEFKKTKYNTRYDAADNIEQKVEAARPSMQEMQSRIAAQNAINNMERGNTAAEFRNPVYQAPLPSMLIAAWRFWETMRDTFWDIAHMTRFSDLREMARSARGYADFLVWEKNYPEAERAARASIGVGDKMAGDWPVKDQVPGDGSIMNSLVGISIAGMGYKALTQIGQSSGDASMAQQTSAEQAAFNQQVAAYKKILANAATISVYDLY